MLVFSSFGLTFYNLFYIYRDLHASYHSRKTDTIASKSFTFFPSKQKKMSQNQLTEKKEMQKCKKKNLRINKEKEKNLSKIICLYYIILVSILIQFHLFIYLFIQVIK